MNLLFISITSNFFINEICKFGKNQSLRLAMTCSQLRGISKNTEIIKDSGPWVWKQFLKEKTKTWYCVTSALVVYAKLTLPMLVLCCVTCLIWNSTLDMSHFYAFIDTRCKLHFTIICKNLICDVWAAHRKYFC